MLGVVIMTLFLCLWWVAIALQRHGLQGQGLFPSYPSTSFPLFPLVLCPSVIWPSPNCSHNSHLPCPWAFARDITPCLKCCSLLLFFYLVSLQTPSQVPYNDTSFRRPCGNGLSPPGLCLHISLEECFPLLELTH